MFIHLDSLLSLKSISELNLYLIKFIKNRMVKFLKHSCYLVMLVALSSSAQFKFSGQVSQEFVESKAYLILIDDYKKSSLFLTDQIIQEVTIDSYGMFEFGGDFLAEENRFYKIYVDQCNDNISDFNHLLNHCDSSNSIVFLANNSDSIHFPINEMDQMFCSSDFSRPINNALFQIDSLQEVLLTNLIGTKNDKQREIIFNTYFKDLQHFSTSFNEPLVELYAYHLYANDESFTRDIYLNDLKKSNYYTNLLNRLEKQYPNSLYVSSFENDIDFDNFKASKNNSNKLVLFLLILLFFSLLINFFLIRKKRKKKSAINYEEVLSPQELKVFKLMLQKLPNKEIADKLFISVSTVKTHVNNIYTKLSISSRKELDQFN